MPSEHRLHPLSILFNLGTQVRAFALPGLLFLFGASSAGMGWDAWLLWLLIPYALVAVLRYVTFRYAYDDAELVIRSGLLFRNERHVPYGRIQNIDAVQNLVHRAFGVVTVRLQTAGGTEPEATMSVLPLADLARMRARVFAGRAAPEGQAPEGQAVESDGDARAARGRTLLHLSPRDLLLYGFIENRGLIVVSAAFGLLYEAGALDGVMDRVFGDEAWGRGVARDAARAVFGDHVFPARRVLLMLAAFVGFLLVVRVLSMAWAAIRLYGFTLTRKDDDLQTRYGLLTRITTTVPLRRVQAVTIREGPLHRWAGRVSVRVVTAGGKTEGPGAVQREWIAPLVGREGLSGLLGELVPGFEFDAVGWRRPHPRAFRREVRRWLAVATLVPLPFVMMLGWWDLALFAVLVAWAWLVARQRVACLGWALTDVAVLCQRGWIWRYIAATPLAKIQAVTERESPFDRRTAMGRVVVDTAGAGDDYRVSVPYLPKLTADDLAARLTAEAARTAFRW